MNETSTTPLHQCLQAYEPSSQPETSLCAPQHQSIPSNSMDRADSPIRPSSPHSLSTPYSASSVEFILSTTPSPNSNLVFPPPSNHPSYPSLNPYPIPSAQTRRARAANKTARRLAKRLLRREARLTPSEIVALAQKKLEREQMKESEAALLKEACIKRELKRAKRTAISPKTFQTIDIHEDSNEEDSACEQVIITQDCEIGAENEAFAGQIMIQDRLSAMSQALSEHAQYGTLRTEPGRRSFHVDAAISRQDRLTGIAVVHKTHRQDWASLWTAKGYRIYETLDQTDAEAWAIWQALRVILENVHDDRAYEKPQDPCSVAVIYSDCILALRRIGGNRSGGGKVVQKIIAQSVELKRLGVELHLHWVPGHRNIPGNELADLVAKKARQPVK